MISGFIRYLCMNLNLLLVSGISDIVSHSHDNYSMLFPSFNETPSEHIFSCSC